MTANREEIMAELRKVAEADDNITREEQDILDGMEERLTDFAQLLDRVNEDNVVDFKEFGELRAFRQKVFDELFKIALADDVITGDERALLIRALELLPKIR